MKKKKPSLKSSAKGREGSRSKDAPSRGTAKKKSEPSNVKELRIVTPKNIGSLAQSGLIVPDDLDPENETVPLDFTSLNNRRVGAIHSRFAVRHAHALFVRAGNATEVLSVRRKHRLALASFRIRMGKKFRTDKACTEAFSKSKTGKQLEKQLLKLEIKAELLDAVIGGYEDITKAASREMSRRDSERSPRD